MQRHDKADKKRIAFFLEFTHFLTAKVHLTPINKV